LPRSEKFPFLLLAVLVGVFLLFTLKLFSLRFQTGDIYPPYSTLRTDPLGCKALYESLGDVSASERNFKRVDKLPEAAGTTLLFLGAGLTGREDHSRDSQKEMMGIEDPNETFARELEAFVVRGGRLVLSYRPLTGPPPRAEYDPKTKSTIMNAFASRWGVKFLLDPLHADAKGNFEAANAFLDDKSTRLDETLKWRSALYFALVDPAWKTIYARNHNPVLIERKYGSGSIVLCGDSYLFSNEAMRHDRHPELLAWLIGTNNRTIFEESHLGVSENPGMMTLVKKYRIYPALITLMALGLLFIWRNSMSLVPRLEGGDSHADPSDAAKDAFGGLVNLLRRNVPPPELLDSCLAEWKKTPSNAHAMTKEKVEKAASIVAEEKAKSPVKRDLVSAYRKICKSLSPRS